MILHLPSNEHKPHIHIALWRGMQFVQRHCSIHYQTRPEREIQICLASIGNGTSFAQEVWIKNRWFWHFRSGSRRKVFCKIISSPAGIGWTGRLVEIVLCFYYSSCAPARFFLQCHCKFALQTFWQARKLHGSHTRTETKISGIKCQAPKLTIANIGEPFPAYAAPLDGCNQE